MAETDTPLVPDANGMLPNGLHQPTLNVVREAAYEIANGERRSLMEALQDKDMQGLVHGVATISALLAFAAVLKTLPEHTPELIADAIETAPEIIRKAEEEEERNARLKEKVEAMLASEHIKQNPLKVN